MGFYLLDFPGPVPQYAYPRRGGGQPSGTIIIHTAECAMDLDGADDSAENCARFIANRADYGSYHRLVDSDSTVAMVPFEYEAWQDSETNGWGIGISAAVAAGRWLEIPAARRDRIYRNLGAAAAEAVQFMAGRGVDVPIRRISGAEARAGVPGFCAHGDSGLYRSDPGAQFDWELFFEYTRQALGGIAAMGSTEEEDMGTVDSFTPEAMNNLAVMVHTAVKAQLADVVKSVAFQERFSVAMLEKIAQQSGVVIDTDAIAADIRSKLADQIGGK